MDNNELHYNDLRFRAKKDGDWIIPIEFINKDGDKHLVTNRIGSTKNAKENLETEIPHWDFNKTLSETTKQWEKELSKINPNITIENIQRIQKTDFMVFLRKILDMTHDYDPQEMIEREFDKHIIESNKNYTSSQIEFLELLKKVFSRTKQIKIEDFAEPPLSNERPLDKFQVAELEKIVTICGKIRMK